MSKFITVYGKHPVMEILRAGRRSVSVIQYVEQPSDRMNDMIALAKQKGVKLNKAEARYLSNRTKGANHQGVIAMVEPSPLYSLSELIERVKSKSETPVVVVMDSIVDPQNFGAVLRSAETFGVAGVIFAKDRSCDINSTVIKASAGATEYLDFCRVPNLARAIVELDKDGFQTIATAGDGGRSLNDFRPVFPIAVVLGSEEKGVRPLVRKRCSETVRIPLAGRVESLNVSAAAAIIFYKIFE